MHSLLLPSSILLWRCCHLSPLTWGCVCLLGIKREGKTPNFCMVLHLLDGGGCGGKAAVMRAGLVLRTQLHAQHAATPLCSWPCRLRTSALIPPSCLCSAIALITQCCSHLHNFPPCSHAAEAAAQTPRNDELGANISKPNRNKYAII